MEAVRDAYDDAPPMEVLDVLNQRCGDIVVISAVASEALEIANDGEASVDDFTRVVERDSLLAIEMLRLANSAGYGLRTTVVSLHQAANLLGFRRCRNLIFTSCLSSLLKRFTGEQDWIRHALWEHSCRTAVAATQLNCRFKLGFDGEEYTAGLIHDLGRALLAEMFPDKFSQFDGLTFLEGPNLLQRESRQIQTDHAAIAAWFIKSQGLPQPLVEVVRYHHDIRSSQYHTPLVALVAAADDIANHLQRVDSAQGYVGEDNEGIRVLEELGYPQMLTRFATDCHEMIERANNLAKQAMS